MNLFRCGRRPKYGWITTVLLGGGLACSTAYGETSVLEHFNPVTAGSGGIHLYGVTVSSGYYSGSYGLGTPGLVVDNPGESMWMIQTSAVVGWSRSRPKKSINIVYSPSYVRSLTSFKYASWNHSLSISAGAPIRTKWVFSSSANAILTDFNQLLFAPSQVGQIASTPGNFDDLASAVLTGRSGNPALTQVVNSATVVGSPEQAYLYGARLLSASASISASYTFSTRSALTVAAFGNRTQQFVHGSDEPVVASRQVPKTSSANVSIGWSYSLTPRTTFGVDASSTRTISRFQDAYNTSANVSRDGRSQGNCSYRCRRE